MSAQRMPAEVHNTILAAVTYALHAAKFNMKCAMKYVDGRKLQQHFANEVARLEEAQQYLFDLEISA